MQRLPHFASLQPSSLRKSLHRLPETLHDLLPAIFAAHRRRLDVVERLLDDLDHLVAVLVSQSLELVERLVECDASTGDRRGVGLGRGSEEGKRFFRRGSGGEEGLLGRLCGGDGRAGSVYYCGGAAVVVVSVSAREERSARPRARELERRKTHIPTRTAPPPASPARACEWSTGRACTESQWTRWRLKAAPHLSRGEPASSSRES